MKAKFPTLRTKPRRYFFPYFVLAMGFFITVIVSYYVWRTGEARDIARFNTSTQDLITYFRGRPRLYIEVLRAGTSLFAVNPTITPHQFRNFVDRLELKDQYPGSQAIGFGSRAKSSAENQLIRDLDAGKFPFRVWPESSRLEKTPVTLFEPLSQTYRPLLGYDMASDPARAAAMEEAMNTGVPVATGRVMVAGANDGEEPGFVIYVPVYRQDSIPTTVDERVENLSGFLFCQFRAAEFVAGIMSIRNTPDIDFKLFDGTEPLPDHLLHDTASVTGTPPDFRPRFTSSSRVEVAGRTWLIQFASQPSFIANRTPVYYALMAGAILTLLLFGLTRSQVAARAAAENAAGELHVSERKVRQTLTERERAEAAVKESEERYRELVENANDIVFTLDLDGNVKSMNKAVESITGYTVAELMGVNMREFLTGKSDQTARSMTQKKLSGEERTNYEVEVLKKDGGPVTLEISSRLAFNQGVPVGIQGVARDITSRRQAEETLRQADQRALSEYERLLERVTGLAQTLGTARDLVAIFRGLKEFTMVSVPCDGFFVSLYDPLRNVRTACYGWADGEEIDTTALPPMPVTSGGPNSRAVRTNQVVITNDYMRQTLGHPAVLVGPDNGMRPQSSLSAPMAVMGRIVGTIEVQSYEKAAYQQDHVTAMRMAANLTAVAIENVTLLERESTARANAEESNRLKDEFLATVSHELRTPLTAILGWSRMLETTPLESDMGRRAIETIKRNAKAQAQIIDDILDVSRIVTGHLYLELHPIELESVLEAAVNVVRPTAEAKGIQLSTDFGSEPIAVSGDSNRLQQVFWNLLSNAVKFTPAGGKVDVILRSVNSHAEISVLDNGQGIHSGFLPFVFDRFRQADSTSTRQHGGLGLGLAIARHLIEIHGGSIEAHSDGEGAGARFTVKLPLVGSQIAIPVDDFQIATAGELSRSQEVLAGLHVLMVDDDDDTLELLSAALKQRSANVTAVSSVAEAIEAIHMERPDVLISDIAMPNEDGYALIRSVSAMGLNPPLPAIAITAYAKEEDRDNALAAGFYRYLSKPVELNEFISTVAEAARATVDASSTLSNG